MIEVPESKTVLPPAKDAPELVLLGTALQAPTVAVLGPDGERTPLPDEVRQALHAVVEAMSQGLAVTITPHRTELTVQEAADLLGMDRRRLVRLLDHGKIPFHHRGPQRQVMLADVIDYRERVRAKQRATLEELTQTATKATHDATSDGAGETR